MNIHHTVTDRFLRYVKIDTQSDPESATCPSTMKQKDLGKVLVEELLAMGISDAHLDEHGYVYATIPSNTSKNELAGGKRVPVICFCSHMDTSPDCTGKNVNPVVHKNYNGKDIKLLNDKTQVLRVKEHPDLKKQKGNDVSILPKGNLSSFKNGMGQLIGRIFEKYKSHILLNQKITSIKKTAGQFIIYSL